MPDNDDVDTSSAPAVKWDYRKILSLITIEPFIACWWLPAAMTLGEFANIAKKLTSSRKNINA